MNEALRARLVEAGIPREEHTYEGIAAYFPPEFEPYTGHLDAEMLAEALLLFVRHGVLSLTQGLDAATIARRELGSHICHFYREEGELLALVSAYLDDGLARGQRCLWVAPGGTREESVKTTLRALGLGDDDGRVTVLDPSDVYQRADGTLKAPGDIIAFWRDQEGAALAAGYRGLRVVGDVSWLGSHEASWRAFLDYEDALQHVVGGTHLLALCTFALGRVPVERLAETLRGHDCGVVHRRGAWDEIRSSAGAVEVLRALAGRAS